MQRLCRIIHTPKNESSFYGVSNSQCPPINGTSRKQLYAQVNVMGKCKTPFEMDIKMK